MQFLLDANSVILALSGHPRLLHRLSQCDEGTLGVSAVVFAEVALGTARGKAPSLAMLAFDEADARTYATLPFKRGSYDHLIAAHALSLDLTLVTNNEDDFADIPGLRTENWTL